MFSHLPKALKEMVVEFVDTQELLKFPQINHDLRQFVLQNGPFSKTLRELVIFTQDAWSGNNELYTKKLRIFLKTQRTEYTFKDRDIKRDIKLLIYFIKKIRFCQEISIVGLNRGSLFSISWPDLLTNWQDSFWKPRSKPLKVLNFLPAIKNVKKWMIFQTHLEDLSFLLNKLDFGSCKELTIGAKDPIGEEVSVKNLDKPIDCEEVKVLNRDEILVITSHLKKQRDESDRLENEKIREDEIKRLVGAFNDLWKMWKMEKVENDKELAEKTEKTEKSPEKLTQEKKIWKRKRRDGNRSIKFRREKHQQMKRQNFQRKQ